MTGLCTALTVAGSDSGGGAGIQADMLTFAANGVFATSAIAALTAQNPGKVCGVFKVSAQFLSEQLNAVVKFFAPKAMKCGMLFDADCINALADFAEAHPKIRFVADTVMISTSGAKLLSDNAVDALKNRLLPLAEVITPNLDEAQFLLGKPVVDIFAAAKELSKTVDTSVLLKGGHLKSDILTDVLYTKSGKTFSWQTTRIPRINTHGSGCTLSAAICANFAKGFSLETSVENARKYLLKGMQNPVLVAGENFINHFPHKK